MGQRHTFEARAVTPTTNLLLQCTAGLRSGQPIGHGLRAAEALRRERRAAA